MGNILWLASYPKSGNTWLRAFLHNLFSNAREPVDINEMSQFTHGDSNTKWFTGLDARPPTDLTKQEIAALRPRAHQKIAETSADTVMVKTHNAMVNQADVPMITPALSAGAIYVVRNPLDVAVSYADHLGVSFDQIIEAMGQKYFQSPPSATHVPEVYCDWSTHVNSWTQTSSAGLHVVRYEDMQKNPNGSFRSIAEFMGVKPPRDRLKRAIQFSSFKVLRAQEKRRGFVERTPVQKNFFRQGKAEGWRQALSDAQVQAIVDRHREQMTIFDYIPEGL